MSVLFSSFPRSSWKHVVDASSGFLWFFKDHLGNTRHLDDASFKCDYYPYGEEHYTSGSSTQIRYTGKELDSNTGLTYFGARYYDRSIARWLAPDPAGQYWSPYAYCGNSPLVYVDEDGELAFLPILLAIGKAAAISVAIDVGTEYLMSQTIPGYEFNYGLNDFLKSAGEGAVTLGFNKLAKGKRLGKLAYNIATKTDIGHKFLRSVQTSLIYTGVNIAVDSFDDEIEMDNKYFRNIGTNLAIMTGVNFGADVLKHYKKWQPEQFDNYLTKKELKHYNRLLENGDITVDVSDYSINIETSVNLKSVQKMMLKSMNQSFTNNLYKRIVLTSTTSAFQKYINAANQPRDPSVYPLQFTEAYNNY